MDISKRLIDLRKKCGYTQNGLAERAGVSQTHLRRVELGQADITVGHLQLLCDAMSISLKEFFEEDTNTDEISVVFSKLSPKQQKLLLAFLEDLGNKNWYKNRMWKLIGFYILFWIFKFTNIVKKNNK